MLWRLLGESDHKARRIIRVLFPFPATVYYNAGMSHIDMEFSASLVKFVFPPGKTHGELEVV